MTINPRNKPTFISVLVVHLFGIKGISCKEVNAMLIPPQSCKQEWQTYGNIILCDLTDFFYTCNNIMTTKINLNKHRLKQIRIKHQKMFLNCFTVLFAYQIATGTSNSVMRQCGCHVPVILKKSSGPHHSFMLL